MGTAGPWSDINAKLPSALCEETIQSLNVLNKPTMTPVQRISLENLLNFKDVAVEAVTGSGKTLAYVVPAIEILRKYNPNPPPILTVLILVPTRELAQQVFDVISEFIEFHKFIAPQLLIGGSQVVEDIKKFNESPPNIVVATPGKLNEFIHEMPAAFKGIQLFVVDEADQILKNGMEAQLTYIFESIPRQRRTGLFSATLTPALHEIIRTGMRNPVFLKINTATATPSELSNFYAIVDPNYKFTQLIHFLRTECRDSKIILFVLTGFIAEYFHDALNVILKDEFNTIAFYGKMSQNDRIEALQKFRDSKSSILIATDVAARGIDIPDIDWIVQYDAPQDWKMFIHRVGRTARIGNKGKAILFLREHEWCYVDFMASEKVVLLEREIGLPEDRDSILMAMREEGKNNSKFYEKSIRAMVSYARAYGEHKLNVVLRKKEVDWIALGNSFGLVRLPVMPEITDKEKAKEYNLKYAEYNVPYVKADAELPSDVSKPKKKKKKQDYDDDGVYQKKFRKGFRPSKPHK